MKQTLNITFHELEGGGHSEGKQKRQEVHAIKSWSIFIVAYYVILKIVSEINVLGSKLLPTKDG